MTITLVFGSYGSFYVSFKNNWRICLGWVALTVYFFDIENVLEDLIDKKQK